MNITEVASPFDDLESPTTVATPSCCCCCCCCLATISSATVIAGRVVRRDAIEGPHADPTVSRAAHIVFASALPIGLIAMFWALAAWFEGSIGRGSEWAWAALAITAVAGVGVMYTLRVSVGADNTTAFGGTLLMAVLYPVLIVVEVFAVLFTIGIFWLSIPLWIWAAVTTTKTRAPAATMPPPPPIPPPPPTSPPTFGDGSW